MSLDAMKQALAALEQYTNVVTSSHDPNSWVTVADGGKPAREAITALRAAIEQPERVNQCGETCERAKLCATCARGLDEQPEQEPFCYHDGCNIVDKEYADHSDVFPLYTAPRQRQTQEPVAWVYPEALEAFKNGKPWVAYGSNGDQRIPLYPAPRQWQGLTDEEIDALEIDENGLPNSHLEFARAIEAKLRDKNA